MALWNRILNSLPWVGDTLDSFRARTRSAASGRRRLTLEALEDRVLPAPTPSGNGYSPSQIQEAYGMNRISFGSTIGDGTGQTIAIVDAYDDPGFVNSTDPNFNTKDLHQFDQGFGLPDPPSFVKTNQTGSTTALPGTDPVGAGNLNWEYEEALEVEWAHAIAPKANILLIEANRASEADLLDAVGYAGTAPGVSVVLMGFTSGEFSGETNFDNLFATPAGHTGITFLAPTGDSGAGAGYPASSPNVVAVGGTSLSLNPNDSYLSESGWIYGGGGISTVEAQPSYQKGVVTQTSTHRAVPDVAFDADPNTGVAVFDSYNNGPSSPWEQFGGTELAAAAWAGLIAIADQGRALQGESSLDGATQTLPKLSSLPPSDFHDVTTGNNGYPAGPGYDLVTGLGSPMANLLVPALAGFAIPPSALTYTVPSSGTHTISLQVNNGIFQVLDNTMMVVSQPVSTTTAVALIGGSSGADTFDIRSTAAGIATTINLQNATSVVDVAGTSGVQNIQGTLTVEGTGSGMVIVDDSLDSGSHTVTIGNSSITGLAPAAIDYRGVSGLTVHGSTGTGNRFTITGTPGTTRLVDESSHDTVVLESTSGTVVAQGLAGDVAYLYGAVGGSNIFRAGPGSSQMSGPGYVEETVGFQTVHAISRAANDSAYLFGSGLASDVFFDDGADAYLAGKGFFNEAIHFRHVFRSGL
jgi:subtilase family serine protease